MSEWVEHILGEVAEIQTGPFGSQLHMSDYVSVGTPIITVEHLGDNKVVHKALPLVSDNDRSRLSKYVLQEGDIVFSRVGSVDRRAYISSKEDGWMFSGRLLRVRVNPKFACPRYLSYYFGLESFKEYIRMVAVGATMPSINTTILSEAPVGIISLREQRAIAEVLSSLDDKIDLLHRQNKTLEQMAETLFRQWFAGDRQNNWTIDKLEPYIKLVTGYSYKSEHLSESTTALVGLKNFDRAGGFRVDGYKEYTGPYKPEQVVVPGDLIVAHTDITQEAEVLGNPALVLGRNQYNTLVITTDVAKVQPTDYLTKEYLYYLLRTPDFKAYCLGMSNGTTVLHLPKKAVPLYEFAIPPQNLVEKFTQQASALHEKRNNNEHTIAVLSNLRDLLLPKLMNGTVRVSPVNSD